MVNVLIILLILLLCYLSFILGSRYRDLIDFIEHSKGQDEAKPAEIIRSNPARATGTMPDIGGSVVITRKTPEQIEREEEAEADRLVVM